MPQKVCCAYCGDNYGMNKEIVRCYYGSPAVWDFHDLKVRYEGMKDYKKQQKNTQYRESWYERGDNTAVKHIIRNYVKDWKNSSDYQAYPYIFLVVVALWLIEVR